MLTGDAWGSFREDRTFTAFFGGDERPEGRVLAVFFVPVPSSFLLLRTYGDARLKHGTRPRSLVDRFRRSLHIGNIRSDTEERQSKRKTNVSTGLGWAELVWAGLG